MQLPALVKYLEAAFHFERHPGISRPRGLYEITDGHMNESLPNVKVFKLMAVGSYLMVWWIIFVSISVPHLPRQMDQMFGALTLFLGNHFPKKLVPNLTSDKFCRVLKAERI